ncbi:serine/threonine kinase [Aureococcus anophagefferens]|nr:serine/threonine kinase [Aureococcus anophagefferens]
MPEADYRTVEKLGKGAFSQVYKVERRADNAMRGTGARGGGDAATPPPRARADRGCPRYACKRIDISKMQKNEIADAVNEIRVLASIRHPFIVGFYDSFLAKRERELWIVMEICACGDLASKVERYRKKRKRAARALPGRAAALNPPAAAQMAEGLNCLHEQSIVHRDLKAANIFLAEDGSVKIGDLNVSKRMKQGNLLRTQIGTPYYMSPEVWLNKPYGMSSDIWALGCLVYELCALPPFVGNTFAQLKQGVLVGKYPAVPRAFSYEMSAMIAKMVRVNARERPSVKQILGSEDVKARKASDWYKEPAAMPRQASQGKQQLMDTIVVPHHIRNLQKELPKPCFPDTRPNSPEAVAQKAANDKDRGGRAPPTDRAGTAMPIQPKGSAAQLHAEHRAPAPSQNPYRQPSVNKYAGGYGQPSRGPNASNRNRAAGYNRRSSGYGYR